MKLLKKSTYEEKRSKFVTYLFEVTSKEELKEALNLVKEENKKAKHLLRSAYYLNPYGVKTNEFSEDREPISSMKKLSLELERKDLIGKAVFIVRYYGGVKFGSSYLDRVYFSLGLQILNS
jgi:putative IMPACT (imprinted ancient) family translation regulator